THAHFRPIHMPRCLSGIAVLFLATADRRYAQSYPRSSARVPRTSAHRSSMNASTSGQNMATVKKGITVRTPEWRKHLRRAKRRFWKKQRQAFKRKLTLNG